MTSPECTGDSAACKRFVPRDLTCTRPASLLKAPPVMGQQLRVRVKRKARERRNTRLKERAKTEAK